MNNINIHILNSSGSLTPFKKDIESIGKASIKMIVDLIPVRDVDIVLYADPKSTIPHLGIGAHTYNYNLIFITFDHKHKNLQYFIRYDLDRTLAHELHHTLRMKYHNYGKNLLDAMIFEGLADHFDIELTKKKPQRWDTALTNKQLIDFHKKAKNEYYNKKYNHDAWFFGSKEKKFLKWTAYTLGFDLVRKYLESHPSKKASTLYRTKAEEFIKSSNR